MVYSNIVFSQHAFTRMFARSISPELAKRAIRNGEIIASYLNDQPYPSFLLLYWERGKALHIVASLNESSNTCHVITTYWPEADLWSDDFKTRRQK